LGTTRLAPGRTLGVFWELYGIDPAQGAVKVSITVTRQGGGLLRRVARSLGLGGGGRHHDVRLEWDEVPEIPWVTPRALAVDLSGLSPGRYMIEVSITPPGKQTVTTRREVVIARP
jgi:hypothetical protein